MKKKPFQTDHPRRENYPNAPAWVAALHQSIQSDLFEFKQVFDDYRDWFIALENPTREQAQEYKKNEHRYATAVGISNSTLQNLEVYLKQFAPELL